MKYTAILSLAALATGFVIPSDETAQDLRHTGRINSQKFVSEVQDSFDDLVKDARHRSKNVLDWSEDAVKSFSDDAREAADDVSDTMYESYQDAKQHLEDFVEKQQEFDRMSFLGEDCEDSSHHHHRGDHHHHHKPNLTVYQLIAESKYTTKLAKLIDEFPDLVEALNGTKANYTVFAPTDSAFEKIPDHAPKPSKEQLKALLSYHVSSDFYPAGRVLATRTIPTLLTSDELGDEPHPQRLATEISFRGLTVNFYSRIVAVDIFGTNGVIHGVDSIIIPPPRGLKIITLLPSEFSTLELALHKTGLFELFNHTKEEGKGGTLFAPSNFGFSTLGPRVNAFLFSPYGQKYLKALLEYHVVPYTVLYSDAIYNNKDGKEVVTYPPKGLFHIDLPTLLEDHSLGIDIARYGRLIEIKINAFNRVSVSDGVAKDGVIHALSSVLLPPRKLKDGSYEQWDGESEIEVEDLKARLEPFVEKERTALHEWEELMAYEL